MSYQIRIYMHPDVESVRGENTLALWEAGWPRWVDELAEAGKLMQTRSDNFPSLYRGRPATYCRCCQRTGERPRRFTSRLKCSRNGSMHVRAMLS